MSPNRKVYVAKLGHVWLLDINTKSYLLVQQRSSIIPGQVQGHSYFNLYIFQQKGRLRTYSIEHEENIILCRV